METRITYWQAETFWLGYWEDFPDHFTQGKTLEELLEMLRSLRSDLESEPSLTQKTLMTGEKSV